jgi:hypothetical protein
VAEEEEGVAADGVMTALSVGEGLGRLCLGLIASKEGNFGIFDGEVNGVSEGGRE